MSALILTITAPLSNTFLVKCLPSEYFLQQSTLPHTLSGRKERYTYHSLATVLASSLYTYTLKPRGLYEENKGFYFEIIGLYKFVQVL